MMFCNYCGKPNPDDASFCGACGKPIERPHTGARAASPAGPQPPRPVRVTPVYQPARTVEAGNPVRAAIPAAAPAPETSGTSTAAPASPAAPAARKRGGGVGWNWIIMIPIVFLMTFPYRDGPTICEATRHEVSRQVPFSVEILASRHPFTVGLLRSALNSDGAVDRFADDYLMNEMSSRNPGAVSCYMSYYSILLNKDRFRESIADWFETQFHLK